MKYLIHTQYCWYDTSEGEKLVLMYFIQNVPFTFDELPEIQMETRYDNQENFSEVATEIQIEESFFEATQLDLRTYLTSNHTHHELHSYSAC